MLHLELWICLFCPSNRTTNFEESRCSWNSHKLESCELVAAECRSPLIRSKCSLGSDDNCSGSSGQSQCQQLPPRISWVEAVVSSLGVNKDEFEPKAWTGPDRLAILDWFIALVTNDNAVNLCLPPWIRKRASLELHSAAMERRLISLDIIRAFGWVWHSLLAKLHTFGFCPAIVQWRSSLLKT